MKKLLLTLFCLLAVGASALAETEIMHYTPQKSRTKGENIVGKTFKTTPTAVDINGFSWDISITTVGGYNGEVIGDGTSSPGDNKSFAKFSSSGTAYAPTITLTSTAFSDYEISSIQVYGKGGARGSKGKLEITVGDQVFSKDALFSGTNPGNATFTLTAPTSGTITIKLSESATSGKRGVELGSIIIIGNKKPTGPTEVTLTAPSDPLNVVVGDEFDIPVTSTPEIPTSEITYSVTTGNENGLSISDNKITAIHVGNYEVTASVPNTEAYEASPVTFKVNVGKATPELSWSTADFTAVISKVNEFPTLTNPLNLEVTYSSSNETVAKFVEGTSNIELLATSEEGSPVVITAKVGDGVDYEFVTASYNLNVILPPAIENIVLIGGKLNEKGQVALMVGESFKIDCETKDATWKIHTKTNTEDIEYTLGEEIYPPFRAQAWNYILTATKGDVTRVFEFAVKVSKYILEPKFENESLAISRADILENPYYTNHVGYGNSLIEGHTPAEKYSIDSETIATINPTTGELKFTGKLGKAKVTAVLGDDDWYGSRTMTYDITVFEDLTATYNFQKKDENGNYIASKSVDEGGYGFIIRSGSNQFEEVITDAKEGPVNLHMEGQYRVWTDYTFRMYAAAKITLSTIPGYLITKVAFVYDGNDYGDQALCNADGSKTELSDNSWSSESGVSSVSFTSKAAKQNRIKTITIQLSAYDLPDPKVVGFQFDGKRIEVVNHDHTKGGVTFNIAKILGDIATDNDYTVTDGETEGDVTYELRPLFTPFKEEHLSEADRADVENFSKLEHLIYAEPVLDYIDNGNLNITAKHAGLYEFVGRVNENSEYEKEAATAIVQITPNFNNVYFHGINFEGANGTFKMTYNVDENPYAHVSYIDPGHPSHGVLDEDGNELNSLEYAIDWRVRTTHKQEDPKPEMVRAYANSDDNEKDWQPVTAKGFDLLTDTHEADAIHLRLHTNGVTATHTINVGDVTTGVDAIESEDGEAVYYDLNGNRIANPERGLYIRVKGGKAEKLILL